MLHEALVLSKKLIFDIPIDKVFFKTLEFEKVSELCNVEVCPNRFDVKLTPSTKMLVIN